MNKKLLAGLYFFSRVYSLLLMYTATLYIPYLGFMAHPTDLSTFNLPRFISALGNFDGIHYLRIALRGYEQFTPAFFPLYPILIRIISYLTLGNSLVAGIVISNVAFFLAIFIFKDYINEVYKDSEVTKWSLIYLILFPSSFFLMSVYTESTFILLLISSLYFLVKKKYFWAGIAGYLLGLTRVNGVFLAIPLFLSLFWFDPQFKKHIISFPKRLLVFLAPCLGLATYMGYLWKVRHDPLYFFHVQEAFNTGRSNHIIFFPQVIYRYFRIFCTARHTFQYYIALLELSITFIVLTLILYDIYKRIKQKKKGAYYPLQLGLSLFSLASIHLSTFTGTLIGIPRYSLLCLGFFIALPTYIKSTRMKIFILN